MYRYWYNEIKYVDKRFSHIFVDSEYYIYAITDFLLLPCKFFKSM